MKKAALCLGFCYRETENPLTSTYMDLWSTCEYLHQKGFHCYVVDDCTDLNYVNQVYTERKLHTSFLNFYLLRKSSWFTKTTYRSELIEEAFADVDQFVFYYTGHISSQGFFEFDVDSTSPANAACRRYSIANVFRYLSELLPTDCQVFAIVDGCYSGNHPFSHTVIEGEVCLTKHSFPMRQQCIYLYSSDLSEKAGSSTFQSYFTKYLLRELAELTSNVLVLLEKLQGRLNYRSGRKAQTLGVALSMPLPLVLWPWIFGFNFEVRGDYVLSLTPLD